MVLVRDYIHYPSEGSLYETVQRGGQMTYGSHTFWETGAGVHCLRLKGGSLTTSLKYALGSRSHLKDIFHFERNFNNVIK